MKTVLVVPTIRVKNIAEFLEQWDLYAFNSWDEIVVVEDNPEKSFDLDLKHHYSWKEIEEDLGEDAWIISHRDSSVRSYGFLVAHRLGADVILTLDDDCLPVVGPEDDPHYRCDFVREHLINLTETPRWTESIPNQRTRGLPYFNKGVADNVVMSVGLWQGVPDFDAIQTLSGANQKIRLPKTRVLPAGQYVPVCGMNLAFKREFLPACYFLLQGEGYPFRRFDDIWFGVITKRIADHLKLMITMGYPYIHHARASDPMTNLVKEAPGVKFNERFWEIIHGIKLTEDNVWDCAWQIGDGLTKVDDEYGYCKKLGEAFKVWCRLLN